MATYKNLKPKCTKHVTIFVVVTIINLDYKARIHLFSNYFIFYLLLVYYHLIITYLTKIYYLDYDHVVPIQKSLGNLI